MITIDGDMFLALLKMSQYCCSYCGISLEDDKAVNVDHKNPRSLGGGATLENLAACCKVCAKLKGHKTVEEFRTFVFNTIAETLDKTFDMLDKVRYLMEPADAEAVETSLVNAKVRLKRFVDAGQVVFFFEKQPVAPADDYHEVTASQLN